MNAGGNSSIAADVQDNLSENYIPDPKIIVGFSIICTASYFFAQFFPALKLPKITGAYLHRSLGQGCFAPLFVCLCVCVCVSVSVVSSIPGLCLSVCLSISIYA